MRTDGLSPGGLRPFSRAVEERDTVLALARIWPAYDLLRGDPAFERVMREVRL